jgi:diguanylate cyclase (GGDEF)-like protein/PAS domain S-box-containing protein
LISTGFIQMTQTYKSLYRFILILILGGFCKVFWMNFYKTIHPIEQQASLDTIQSQQPSELYKNSQIHFLANLTKKTDRDLLLRVVQYLLISQSQLNRLSPTTLEINAPPLRAESDSIPPAPRSSGGGSFPGGIEDGQNDRPDSTQTFLQQFVGSEFDVKYLIPQSSGIIFLWIGATAGGMMILVYGVYKLKQGSIQKIDGQSYTYLTNLLTQFKKYPEITELITEDQILLDASGTIRFIAKNLVNKLDYEPEEVFQQNIDKILTDRDVLFKLDSGQNESSVEPRQIITTLKGKHKHIPVLMSGVIVKKNGSIEGMVLLVTDITASQELTKAQRDEKRFRQLAETVPMATFIYQDKKFVYVNSAMESLTGYNKATLLTMNCWQVIAPEFHKLIKKGLRRKNKSQQPVHWHGEIKMIAKTKEERWVDFSVSLIKFDRKIALLATAFDLSNRKHMEKTIKASEQRYRHLIELSPAAIFVHKKGQLVFLNPAAIKLLGAGSSKYILGKPLQKFWLEDYKQLMQAQFHQASKNGGILEPIEHKLIRVDDQTIEMASTFTPVIYEAEPAIMTTGIDITERKQAEQALKESEARYKQLLGSVTDYIYTVKVKDGKALATDHGHGCIAVTGYSPEEYTANPHLWSEIVYPDDLEAVKNQAKEILTKGSAEPLEHRIIQKKGDVRWVRNTPVVRKDNQGNIISYDGLISDITERKQAEEQVNYQAFHDLLTGLPNRSLYNQRLSEALTKAKHQEHNLAVMFLDLDRFKTINDTLGHAIGDLLLQQVAQRICNCLRQNDTLSRWGGDEFTLLLPHIHSPEDAVNVAQRIIASLKPVFNLSGHQLHITTSIGMAIYPQDGENLETLLGNADVALYRAKEQRSTYRVYAATMNSQASELLALQNSLHAALERKEFQVYYQPQVNVKSRQIVGMEALVRWQHPELGLVPPGRFIPLAEETGLIVEIGEWVLRTACEQNKSWLQAGFSPIQMGVNLSARQFQEPNLVEMVADILETTGLRANLLELEITETIAMQNVEWTSEVLGQLQSVGVNLSMDDFGTGYSSLSYLQKFPFHTLKVDKSFVQDISIDDQDRAIAQAVIALGRSLGLRVIAEGVETVEQLAVLRRMNCEDMQGFLFSRPLPALNATKLLMKHNRHSQKNSA